MTLLSYVTVVLCLGCSWLNAPDLCTAEPIEVRINDRGDNVEFINHPQAIAELRSGHLLTTWVAQSEDSSFSEVRYAVLDPTGVRVTLCDSDELERTISGEGQFAASPVAVRANIPIAAAAGAVGAIGWTELVNEDRDEWAVHTRLIDASGCPISSTFSPVASTVDNPRGLSLAWSAADESVLAALHDGNNVMVARVVSNTWGETATVASSDQVFGNVACAVARSGNTILAWTHFADRRSLLEGQVTISCAVLDQNWNVTKLVDLDLPNRYARSGLAPSVAVSAGENRFAILSDLSPSTEEPPSAFLVELDHDGLQLAGARELGAGPGSSSAPAATYGKDEELFVTWLSASDQGTVGALFSHDGTPRFASTSCDEAPFTIGSRNPELIGQPAPLYTNDRFWVMHTARTPSDPRSTAVLGWSIPRTELWPVR